MTDGTSQGLFVVVAIVIFGIFIALANTVFGSEGLTKDLKILFEDSIEQATVRKKLVYSSNKEVNNTTDLYRGGEEFMQYGTDLSPIVEEHGLGEYIFEFEIKSSIGGPVRIYTQNGESQEYVMESVNIPTTTEYQKVTVKTNMIEGKSPEYIDKSLLAFYGVYGTGVYPTVKNMRIYKVL